MDELVTTVDQSWNAEDPTRPEGMGWIGSEDFLRGKFEVRFPHFILPDLVLGRDTDTRDSVISGIGVRVFVVGVRQVWRFLGERSTC